MRIDEVIDGQTDELIAKLLPRAAMMAGNFIVAVAGDDRLDNAGKIKALTAGKEMILKYFSEYPHKRLLLRQFVFMQKLGITTKEWPELIKCIDTAIQDYTKSFALVADGNPESVISSATSALWLDTVDKAQIYKQFEEHKHMVVKGLLMRLKDDTGPAHILSMVKKIRKFGFDWPELAIIEKSCNARGQNEN